MNMQTEAASYAARLSNIALDLDQGAMPDGLDVMTIRKVVDLLRRWPDEDAPASAPGGPRPATGVARSIAPGESCQFEGCDRPAEVVVEGSGYPHPSPLRHPGLGVYCEDHGENVADEGDPEYLTTCPNCKCRFGV